MAKFNMNTIKGMQHVSDTAVGEGLLSEASRKEATNLQHTEYIDFYKLVPNPMNNMSLDESEIKDLANNIYLNDNILEQPVVVRQMDDGRYMLLAGHKRREAIKLLIDEGLYRPDNLVEAKIKDLDDLKLPLNDDLKELFLIRSANKYRTMTDADRAVEINDWSKLFSELKKQGHKTVVIPLDDGTESEISLQGKKRDLVAKAVGVSPAQVGKFEKVTNQGSEKLQNALLQNRVPVTVAADLAGADKKTQDTILESIEKKKKGSAPISASDVETAKKNLTGKALEEQTVVLTPEQCKQDIQGLLKLLNADGVTLSAGEYKKYTSHIKALKKLLA